MEPTLVVSGSAVNLPPLFWRDGQDGPVISNERRLKYADDKEHENYQKKDQEHKGTAMRWIGILVHPGRKKALAVWWQGR